MHQIFFKPSYEWISFKGPIIFELPTSKCPVGISRVGNSDTSSSSSRSHLAFIFLVSPLLKSWLQKRTAKQDACVRDNIISKSTRLPSNIEARGWSWFRDLEIEKAILVWRLRKLSLFKLRKLFLRYSESIPLIEIWESNSCLTFEK